MNKLDVHTTPKLIHYAIVNGLPRAEPLRHRPAAGNAEAAVGWVA